MIVKLILGNFRANSWCFNQNVHIFCENCLKSILCGVLFSHNLVPSVPISSTILKFLQGFRKLVFLLLLTKFSIFLKSTCSLLAIFLKFILNQEEKRSFIRSKTIFCFKNLQSFSQKKECSYKVAFLEFRKYRKK